MTKNKIIKSKLENTLNINKKVNNSINWLIFFSFLLFFLLIINLFNLQIRNGEKWKQEAENQYFSNKGDLFNRGAIFFDNKKGINSPAVEMINEYDIAIDPNTLKTDFDKKISKENYSLTDLENNLYQKIKEVFDEYNKSILESSNEKKVEFIEKDLFLAKIKKDSSYEMFVKNIPEDIANKLLNLGIRALIINRNKTRVYFEKELASKVLGFVGFSENNTNKKTGLYGLEKYYNDVLQKDKVSNKNFFAEVFGDLDEMKNNFKNRILNNNIKGDLNLTLEVNVEKYLNNLLQKVKNEWNSEKVGGIVMDINDGSIIAMEELPTFDANDYKSINNISLFNNNLISSVYEMGSIIKPLTMAAALDKGVVNENTTYNDTGFIMIDTYRISNFDKTARGPNTGVQQILSQSLNVGIAFLVKELGKESLNNYFHRFGIGEYTGIDLPGELSGLTSNLTTNIMVDSVTAGFGQGIAITPIQTIRALATLGNGGKLISPHIVRSITYENGDTKILIQDDPKEVFDNPLTSQKITNMLVKVVEEGMHYKDQNYKIASKTGTAQIVNPATGKYYEDRYLHSFFGYFPATKPKYIIFLYQTYPKGAQYASQTLKKYFFELVDYLGNYFEILPDRNN